MAPSAVRSSRLAAIAPTIAASAPPIHMVKPSEMQEEPETDHERVAEKDGGVDRLAAGEAGVDLVPVGDVLLAQPPAEEDRLVVAQRIEVHQPASKPLNMQPIASSSWR